MKNYSKLLQVPQTQPIPGKVMIPNNAGGLVFETTAQESLERFLLIGSEGGTYYVNEKELTIKNATRTIDYIKQDGLKVVATVIDTLQHRKAPKVDPAIFVLALAATYGDQETKDAVYKAIPEILYTGTHLFQFIANVHTLRGWSRGLRTAVARWYTTKASPTLEYQVTKYRNRAGFTHRDALRLSHPVATSDEQNNLFSYIVGKSTPTTGLVATFEKAQKAQSTEELVALINDSQLTWEMVPTEKLNDKEVLKALLDNMPLTALMRNLNRFSKAGLTEGNSETTKEIVAKLTDERAIRRANIHPINVVNTLLTYKSGHGFRGSSTWEVNQNIVDALSEMYELSLITTEPSGKNILIACDISGSMGASVLNTAMTASQVANVLAVSTLKTEKNAELIWFDNHLQKATFGRRTSLDQVLDKAPVAGGTDCAIPLVYANHTQNKYDAIIILTDTETWAGQTHGEVALAQYRRKVNPNVKVIEIALTATNTSVFEQNANSLRVVGFDSTVMEVVNKFIG